MWTTLSPTNPTLQPQESTWATEGTGNVMVTAEEIGIETTETTVIVTVTAIIATEATEATGTTVIAGREIGILMGETLVTGVKEGVHHEEDILPIETVEKEEEPPPGALLPAVQTVVEREIMRALNLVGKYCRRFQCHGRGLVRQKSK